MAGPNGLGIPPPMMDDDEKALAGCLILGIFGVPLILLAIPAIMLAIEGLMCLLFPSWMK